MTASPAAAVAETHSAVVVFVGARAYKLKKPVNLGFLDFSSRAARVAVCHREVELNCRLAPDVYLGVADINDPAGEPCDHLAVMRRMPADRRLSHLVATGQDVDDHLWHLAHLIAAFHAHAARSPEVDDAATAAAMAARWQGNTTGLWPFAGRFVNADRVALVHRLAMRYLDGAQRHLTEGRVRLVLVGGLPGTGKSTLAAGLGHALGVTVLRSDEVRKELAGLDPATPSPAAFGEGIYSADATARTYHEILDRARTALTLGESVIIDASWHDPAWREDADRLAHETFADLHELQCEAPACLADVRIRALGGRGRRSI